MNHTPRASGQEISLISKQGFFGSARPAINADPSQGSHLFHNITSLGINYLNVGLHQGDRFDWQKLAGLAVVEETAHAVHLRCSQPFILRVDGRKRIGVVTQHLKS